MSAQVLDEPLNDEESLEDFADLDSSLSQAPSAGSPVPIKLVTQERDESVASSPSRVAKTLEINSANSSHEDVSMTNQAATKDSNVTQLNHNANGQLKAVSFTGNGHCEFEFESGLLVVLDHTRFAPQPGATRRVLSINKQEIVVESIANGKIQVQIEGWRFVVPLEKA